MPHGFTLPSQIRVGSHVAEREIRENSRDDPYNLVGKWKCYATRLVGDTYELKEDGSVEMGRKKGTWKIDGDKLVIS